MASLAPPAAFLQLDHPELWPKAQFLVQRHTPVALAPHFWLGTFARGLLVFGQSLIAIDPVPLRLE